MTARRSMFLVVPAALALGWAATVAADDDQKFPATGQTTCYDSAGNVIACAGTGQDGDIQAGATLSYKDNGNGTIRDRNTGLVWEKKSDDEDPNDGNNTTFPHDKDNTYIWDEAFVHVATLNTICANDETVDCSTTADCVAAGVGGKCGFAGKRDWRLPNVKELQSIVNYEVPFPGPGVSAAFNNSCDSGDTVTDGSCTVASNYWSSTTNAGSPSFAWNVFFSNGAVGTGGKGGVLPVRAVRGGL